MLFRSDRKSTRLNSSHTIISYAVFCLKKNKQTATQQDAELMQVAPTATPHTRNRAPTVLSMWPPPSRRLTCPPAGSSCFFFLNTAPPPSSPLLPPPASLPA